MCFTCRGGFRVVVCLTAFAGLLTPGVSAKERPSRAWGVGEGEGGEVRSVMFYEGLRLWEAHLYVFYVSGRLRGGTVSGNLWERVGPLERTSRVRGEGREGGEGGEGAEQLDLS